MRTNLLAAFAAAALLGGCSLAPDYTRPAAPVSQNWPQGAATAATATATAAEPPAWRDFFTDPDLRQLIERALSNNRDLRVAALNIEAARALYRVSDANLYPSVSAGASDTVQGIPRRLSTVAPQRAMVTRTFSANLGVTAFEVDLFGRLRSLEAAALEQYLATAEARSATQIALVAEVANAAVTLLADRKQLALTEETLATRVTSLDLVEHATALGIGSQLDVSEARSLVETARVNRVRTIRQVEQDKNALALLVGAPIDDSKFAQGGDLDSLRFIEELPVGLPSEVLLRRPDISQAEHLLKAANANIGAARAAFFPTISLTGSAGAASPTLGNLFQAASGAWSFAPQITAPIFDAGRNFANLDNAKVGRDIAVAQYEKAIQSAFREVADALAAKATFSEQVRAQSALVDATRSSTSLSQARYERGIDNYLTVLDSQRSLYLAQQDLIAVQALRMANLVQLYKVLGGGGSPL